MSESGKPEELIEKRNRKSENEGQPEDSSPEPLKDSKFGATRRSDRRHGQGDRGDGETRNLD